MANCDTLKKFAQNAATKPASTQLSFRSAGRQAAPNSAIKFEDTKPRQGLALVLDPKLSAQARTVRIFDNIVERASREMT
jgi:hypothetical protein